MIAVGVDTHKDQHVAVALSQLGLLLGELAVAASAAGYRELLAGQVLGEAVVGIEGTGSWGAGLCECLQAVGISVLEVERPRTAGSAAWQVGPRGRDSWQRNACWLARASQRRERRGNRTAFECLLVAQRSWSRSAPGCSTSCRRLHATAPASLRERIGQGNGKQLERRILVDARSARHDLRSERSLLRAARSRRRARAPRQQAGRYRDQTRAAGRDARPDAARRARRRPDLAPPSCWPATPTVSRTKPRSRAATAPRRMPASSGKTIRHRLTRGGDRQANNAIHTIAIVTIDQPPARVTRLPRTPNQRRQDPPRSHALTQTPRLPPASTDDSSRSPLTP